MGSCPLLAAPLVFGFRAIRRKAMDRTVEKVVEMITVSVVVPLFNKQEYVRSAVASVLAQEFPYFELIVVDDGSSDDSVARLDGFVSDPRLRILRQANAGVGASRNRGLREAKGGLIAFLDADDEWAPTHLSDLQLLAQRFHEAGVLATRCGYERCHVRSVDPTVCSESPSLFTNYFRLATRRAFVLNSSSCAIRRSVFADIGGFLEATPLGEDQEYWARAGLRYSLAYHPRVSSFYRLGIPGSAMAVNSWKPEAPPVVATLRNYLALPRNESRLVDDVRNYAAWILLNHIAGGIRRGAQSGVRSLLRDPLLQRCRFPVRVAALRFLSLLPPRASQAAFRAHLSTPASYWRRFYALATHPRPGV